MKLRTPFIIMCLFVSNLAVASSLPKLSCKEAWKKNPSEKTGEPYYIFDFKTQGYEAYLTDETKRKALGCDAEGKAYLEARSAFSVLEPTASTLKKTYELLDQIIELFPRGDRRQKVKEERAKLFQIYEHYGRMKERALAWIKELDAAGERLGDLKSSVEGLPEESEDYEETRLRTKEKNAAWRNCAKAKPYQAFEAEMNVNVTRRKYDEPIARKDCYKEWTVMVAMDGKSDLMPFSLWDLLEMEAGYESRRDAGSTLKKDVLVQHSGTEDDVIRRLQMFQSPTHFQEHQPKLAQEYFESRSIHDVESPVVETLSGDQFEGKSEEFVRFVKWGMKNYPAKRYVVILWGHGKGWFKTDDQDEGVHLSGFELAEALKKIHLDEDGLSGERKIDHFIADACFMQGVEVVTELASHTRYISGSAQIQAFMGLPYRVMFFEMEQTGKNFKRELRAKLKKEGKWASVPRKENGNVDWVELGYPPLRMTAEYLPRVMERGFSSPSSFQGRLVQEDGSVQKGLEFFTFSTVDSSEIAKSLEPALQKFASALVRFIGDDDSRLGTLKFPLTDIMPFRGKRKTRELGSFLQLTYQFVQKEKEAIETKLKEESLGPEDQATAIQDLTNANALVTATEVARDALSRAIPVAHYAPMYREPYSWFRALGVWVPKSSRNYEKGIMVNFDGTSLFVNKSDAPKKTPWHEMIRMIADVQE